MNDHGTPNQPPDPIDLEVGARLRAARRSRAFSQDALAQLLKLTAHEVQRIEQGLDRVSAVMLVQAAEAIGVSPATLLPGPADTSCSQAPDDACAAGGDGSEEEELLMAFHRIGSKDLQSTVVSMARRLADQPVEGAAATASDSASGLISPEPGGLKGPT